MPSVDEATSIKWRKGNLIGSGAFGRVYMGMNTQSGEIIAVKEAHTKVLQEEVRLLENLSHPKIVRCLGTEREDETLTMLLEYVPGGSIQSLLEKFGSFSLPVIKRFTKQLLLALEYLHKNGIIHGDIKGANILVGSKGRIKLADFGTSTQAAISGSKPTRGTPYWMAPEVIRGTGHDFSADIWSVGCTVIEMATGNPPWNQQFETIAAFFYCVGTSKSHPPIPEHLSSAAKDFLHECLQKEPTVRPSASELLKHPFLTGKEVESQNLSHSAVMEVEVASSFCQTNSDEIDSMWDNDANSNSVSNPASGGTRTLIVEGAIKQVFSKISKFFKRSSRATRNISQKGEFSYASIMVATQNFSEENKIGHGAFGPVYKGKLVTGQEVAVKRLSKNSNQGELEFMNELRLVNELQHRNIVKMLGCCIHGDEKVIIYEYMEHESLNYHLYGSSGDLLLDWNKRFNIIEGIAQGLVYLHKYSRLRVIHRDIKAGNVLLDAQMNPKIADFGLAKSIADDEETVTTTRICGTMGYMAPEYLMTGILSMKTDVYSYGVLMLEIISGNKNHKAGLNSLVKDAWQLWQKGAGLELVDPKLEASSINEDQLLRCIHVGLLCTEENEDDRPTMSDAISMLTNERVPLPKPIMPAFSRPASSSFMTTGGIHGNGPETMSIKGLSTLGQSIDFTMNSMSYSDFGGR
ncbi:PREDICTED: G-type lectin S-receptor-like serine/threonine-protein kinase B120 isoform X2 [Fragaria vesca subsp. vesca]|uniref:G-type lectin S-receptor-like serine/threonine-protein kinase B120 isoform X2 n=1 Tax=Fragaria vesca subsp. vesca TaxID=101020 RepID=UPI0002C34331|nr:PREDICTED: G-type lectin S-receptor-like serine/threonine-protein kinase B120 isoform X2 [Fragaria vesca subsp. vesca]